MDRNIPTYYPGDVIVLRLRFHHEADLVDVWANFERQEEVTSLAHFQFTATLRSRNELRLLDRLGTQLTSEAALRASVSKGRPWPGVYELSEVHGLPFGEDRGASSILEFEVPKDLRFRVAATPPDQAPKVTHWELSWESQPRDADPKASV
ncbi:MAG: hypothetical protein M3Q29_17310 [Chloroflexota bacterium]|nr:hypothetical protein [Chloroflexota bacterium]